jgi:polyisoprenoid-binding protein YceI
MTTTAPQTATRIFNGLEIPEPGTFAIDTSHSAAAFSVKHLVVAKTRGRFTDFAGTVTIDNDPLKSSVDVTIQAGSITTGDDKRDGHLRDPDFLDVEQYPTLTYKSTSVRHVKGEHFVVEGDLTIAGVTRSVALDLEYEGVVTDPWGGTRAVFEASAKINREEFGLTYNQTLETGGVLIGKDISIELEVEAVKQ